jgi:hypothetical protein
LPCPKIVVTGPSSDVRPGEDAVFRVDVSGADASKLEYHWSVSAGTIKSGQGTAIIRVSTDGLAGQTIIAEVEVKGLPENCFNRGNETAKMAPVCELPPKIDEYGNLSWEKEKLRLNSAIKQMRGYGLGSSLIITIYFPKGTGTARKKNRRAKLEKYLLSIHKLSRENIQMVEDVGKSRTEIYLVPAM